MVRLRLGLWVVVAIVGCKRAEPKPIAPTPIEAPVAEVKPPSSPNTWRSRSSDGHAVLSQQPSPDSCVLDCSIDGKVVWSQQRCLAQSSDFAFVDEGCSTAMVFFEYPKRNAPLAVVLKPPAEPVSFAGSQVFESASAIKGEGPRVRWLAGVINAPGLKPYLSRDGKAVEVAMVDGRSRTVRFSNPEDLLFVPAARAPVASTNGMYQFVDGAGSTHFVMGLDAVPSRFRKTARPVESEVSTVKGEKLPPRYVYPSFEPQPQPQLPKDLDDRLMGKSSVKGAPANPSNQPPCPFGLNDSTCRAINDPVGGTNRPYSGSPPSLPPPQRPAGW